MKMYILTFQNAFNQVMKVKCVLNEMRHTLLDGKILIVMVEKNILWKSYDAFTRSR